MPRRSSSCPPRSQYTPAEDGPPWIMLACALGGMLLFMLATTLALPLLPRRAPTGDQAHPPDDEPPIVRVDGSSTQRNQPSRFVAFMGSRAVGRRFCIIADTSSSMNHRNRMGRLKEELERTLREMTPEMQFYVILFNNRAVPMPTKGWLSGGTENADSISKWVQGQRAGGGTQPMPAFTRALSLEPTPDVIFFMTDGQIPPNVPAQVAELNGKLREKVRMNTILFGGDAPQQQQGRRRTSNAEGLLQRIARDSGGEHRHVPDEAPGSGR